MKKLLLLLVLLCVGCTAENDSNCDEELQKLEKLRSQGWTNCNGGPACVAKIESDYQNRKKEILNNCN